VCDVHACDVCRRGSHIQIRRDFERQDNETWLCLTNYSQKIGHGYLKNCFRANRKKNHFPGLKSNKL
jgi:hypothetical protein